MKGMRVKYGGGMIGAVIDYNDTHVVIRFDSNTTFCVLKSSVEAHDYFYCQNQIEGGDTCAEQCEHCKEYYKPLEKLRSAEDLWHEYFGEIEAEEIRKKKEEEEKSRDKCW
jgi:nitrate/TMAO reductase-like tetraheme cytochrome c subunit